MMNGAKKISSIRLLLFGEAVVFLMAVFVHAGMGIDRHKEALIAESILAGALYVGLGLSWLRPLGARKAGIMAQEFALFGTLIGIFTIIVGVGPQTIPAFSTTSAWQAFYSWGWCTSSYTHRSERGARQPWSTGSTQTTAKLNGGPDEKQSRMV